MDLKYTQKMLKEKENTRTTADASYQKSKQNLANKEREVAGIKVRRYCCKSFEMKMNCKSYFQCRVNCLKSTMKSERSNA